MRSLEKLKYPARLAGLNVCLVMSVLMCISATYAVKAKEKAPPGGIYFGVPQDPLLLQTHISCRQAAASGSVLPGESGKQHAVYKTRYKNLSSGRTKPPVARTGLLPSESPSGPRVTNFFIKSSSGILKPETSPPAREAHHLWVFRCAVFDEAGSDC